MAEGHAPGWEVAEPPLWERLQAEANAIARTGQVRNNRAHAAYLGALIAEAAEALAQRAARPRVVVDTAMVNRALAAFQYDAPARMSMRKAIEAAVGVHHG